MVAESTAYAAKSAQKKRNNTTKAKAAAVAAKTKAKTRKIGYNELSQLALSLSFPFAPHLMAVKVGGTRTGTGAEAVMSSWSLGRFALTVLLQTVGHNFAPLGKCDLWRVVY